MGKGGDAAVALKGKDQLKEMPKYTWSDVKVSGSSRRVRQSILVVLADTYTQRCILV